MAMDQQQAKQVTLITSRMALETGQSLAQSFSAHQGVHMEKAATFCTSYLEASKVLEWGPWHPCLMLAAWAAQALVKLLGV
jgi:hypothetical protein